MIETLPGSEYGILIKGVSDGARLFVSRFDLLDYIKTFLPDKPVSAEVGVFHGHFSERLLKTLKPCKLHLIDTFSTHDHISNVFTADKHFDYVAKRFESFEAVIMHQGFSHECLCKLEDASLDYIYIDADHSYEGVKKDIEASLKKVKRGGIIHFNDYTNARGYGVLDAVNELLESQEGIKLIGASLDRSGYHDLAIIWDGFKVSTHTPKLTIVTPCSRPENLRSLKKSIDFERIDKWYVVHDTRNKTFVKTFDSTDANFQQIIELECKDEGIVGHPIRNYALNDLVKDGMIYFLDDDNLIHPAFWTLNFEQGKLHTFGMQYNDGRVLQGDVLKVSSIDTAQFVFDVAINPGLRFEVQNYAADGLFIEELAKVIDIHTMHSWHPIVASWYNKLAQTKKRIL